MKRNREPGEQLEVKLLDIERIQNIEPLGTTTQE